MKRSVFSPALLFMLALLVGVAGCSHKPKGPTPIPGQRTGVTSNPTASQPITPPPSVPVIDNNAGTSRPANNLNGTDPNALPGLDRFDGPQDREVLKAYIVLFDFDRYNVKSSETSKVEAVAAYLRDHANENLIIEGHCDERGTEEYNRALGERRALSLREYLGNLGVNLDRILTKSFGEDRPAVEGHDEAAWAKNRRGEFIVVKPK